MSQPDNEFQQSRVNAFIEQSRNKELARQLAIIQEGIVGKLITFSEQNPKRFEIDGFCDKEILLFFIREKFQGINDVSIGIEHSLLGSGVFRAKVGVDTLTALTLGLYTDRETWEAVRELEAYNWEERFGLTLDEVKERVADTFTAEEVDDMTFPDAASAGDNYGTYYFVSRTGDFAKVISIPEELAEGRPDLQIEGNPIGGAVSLQAPMYARDFVIMKSALELIRQTVDRELNLNNSESVNLGG